MSSSINVYAVAVEQLKQAIGSGDEALIEAIVSQHEDFLSSIDRSTKRPSSLVPKLLPT